MYVTVDLTSVPPRVDLHRNPYDSDDEQLWCAEIWPNATDGSETIAILADSLDDLRALGEAIVQATEKARP